jgi:hypothetical protein
MLHLLVTGRLILIALAMLLPLATARAQFSELEPGARVRVGAPHYVSGVVDGTILTQRRDSLKIALGGGSSISVPLAELTHVEVSRRRSWRLGAVRGSMWGAATGLAIGAVATLGPGGCDGDCGHKAVDHLVAIPLSGALLGAGIGALIGAERWKTVTIPLQVTVVPHRAGRVALGLRLGR